MPLPKPEPISRHWIAAQVCPGAVRWPDASSGTNTFDRMREAVEAMRNLLLALDAACVGIEQEPNYSAEGRARLRIDLGRKAIAELEKLPALREAERAIEQNLQLLERRMDRMPPEPTEMPAILAAQEIRNWLRAQQNPFEVVMKSSDAKLLSAVLNAPLPMLSGLSEAQHKMVYERARRSLHGEQVRVQELLQQTSAELHESGFNACIRAIRQRCGIVDDSPATLAMNAMNKKSSEPKPKSTDTSAVKGAPSHVDNVKGAPANVDTAAANGAAAPAAQSS